MITFAAPTVIGTFILKAAFMALCLGAAVLVAVMAASF